MLGKFADKTGILSFYQTESETDVMKNEPEKVVFMILWLQLQTGHICLLYSITLHKIILQITVEDIIEKVFLQILVV